MLRPVPWTLTKTLVLALAAMVAAVVVLGVRAVNILRDGVEFNEASRAAGVEAERVLDPEGFVTLWARSEQSTYAAAGTRRLEGSGVAIESIYVRVQDGDRRIEREGPTAVVEVDGATQTCDQFGEEWRCAAPTKAPPLSDRVGGIALLVSGPDADYAAIREPTGCYTLTANTIDDATGVFGSRSLLCFDDETGALIRSDTTRGSRTERLELSELRSEVTDDDFRLRRSEPD